MVQIFLYFPVGALGMDEVMATVWVSGQLVRSLDIFPPGEEDRF